MKKQFPSVDVVKDEVEFIAGLEWVMQTHEEGMTDVVQENIPLWHDVLDFISSNDCLLLKYFDGVTLLGHFLFAQIYLNGWGGGGGGGEKGKKKKGGERKGTQKKWR